LNAASARCAVSGRDRASRAVERDEESVTWVVDLTSAVRFERVAQKPMMVGSDSRVDVVADLSEEICGPFDVAEEKRDSATRQRSVAHQASSSHSSPPTARAGARG
jgi:hypothetical protein